MKGTKKLLFIAISLFVVVSLSKSILNYQKTLKFYESYKSDLEKEQKKYINLKTQALKNSDPDEIEKIIRNNLNLARESETVLIIPNPTPTPFVPTPTPRPVYRQWIDLFFRN